MAFGGGDGVCEAVEQQRAIGQLRQRIKFSDQRQLRQCLRGELGIGLGEHGGERLTLVPCVNSGEDWALSVAEMTRTLANNATVDEAAP